MLWRAVMVLALVACGLVVGLYLGAQQLGLGNVAPTPPPTVSSTGEDRILVSHFFGYHRNFTATVDGIRDAAARRDWVGVRVRGEALSAAATATALACADLRPSGPLVPFYDAFMTEVDVINATGVRVAAAGAAADPVALDAAIEDLDEMGARYDRVYALLQLVGDGGWESVGAS